MVRDTLLFYFFTGDTSSRVYVCSLRGQINFEAEERTYPTAIWGRPWAVGESAGGTNETGERGRCATREVMVFRFFFFSGAASG